MPQNHGGSSGMSRVIADDRLPQNGFWGERKSSLVAQRGNVRLTAEKGDGFARAKIVFHGYEPFRFLTGETFLSVTYPRSQSKTSNARKIGRKSAYLDSRGGASPPVSKAAESVAASSKRVAEVTKAAGPRTPKPFEALRFIGEFSITVVDQLQQLLHNPLILGGQNALIRCIIPPRSLSTVAIRWDQRTTTVEG